MPKFEVTWWQNRQYGRTIEADSLDDAWGLVWENQVDNPYNVRYVSDEPDDVEIEEVA